MSVNIFIDRKSIHFKLSTDIHAALRTRLFKHNITMQELFDECACLVALDTAKGQSIINLITNKKIKKVLSVSCTSSIIAKKKKKESFNDLDSDALYNMINELEET
jgi:hypothetical protein